MNKGLIVACYLEPWIQAFCPGICQRWSRMTPKLQRLCHLCVDATGPAVSCGYIAPSQQGMWQAEVYVMWLPSGLVQWLCLAHEERLPLLQKQRARLWPPQEEPGSQERLKNKYLVVLYMYPRSQACVMCCEKCFFCTVIASNHCVSHFTLPPHTQGSRAYACQCSWESVEGLLEVSAKPRLKWVCSKHWPGHQPEQPDHFQSFLLNGAHARLHQLFSHHSWKVWHIFLKYKNKLCT